MADTSPLDALAAQPQSKSQKSQATLAEDFDAFLLLLTTQLKHQDPLSPLEPTEFTSQLVQFASVEQQIQSNANLEKLLGVQNANLAASIIGFVGTDVQYEGTGLPLQDGQAKFSYTLSDNAKNTVITITDQSGNLVLTKAGELSAGEHEFVWDGKDGNGLPVGDGAYKVSVTPIGFEDEPINTTVKVWAHVDGVSMDDGGTQLDAGGVKVPLDSVLSIKEPTSQSGS